MTPEAKARLLIDQKLEAAGWVVQDMKQLNLSAGQGVPVREYPTDTDYTEVLSTHEVLSQVNESITKLGLAPQGLLG